METLECTCGAFTWEGMASEEMMRHKAGLHLLQNPVGGHVVGIRSDDVLVEVAYRTGEFPEYLLLPIYKDVEF